jgi:mannose-1-phosphate guanylyltransferase/mannose-6-phosphate isomerase
MKVIILAGGSGKRLWPYSKNGRPKQFLPLFEEGSLFRITLKRWLDLFSKEDVLIVSGKDYSQLIQEELKDFPSELQKRVLLEPESRNTAAAICYGLKFLEQSECLSLEEKVLIVPSDHLLSPQEELSRALQEADSFLGGSRLILFGIEPTRPETGYGYIQTETHQKAKVLPLMRFVEKPSLQEAVAFLSHGGYYWNSGMLLFQCGAFWKEIQKHCAAFDHFFKEPFEWIKEHYAELPPISLDYALLEKTRACWMIPLRLQWQDIGSWDAIYEMEKKDEQGNVLKGNVQPLNCRNTLVLAGNKPISIIGMEDVLVIDSLEGILIVKKGHAQKVKDL